MSEPEHAAAPPSDPADFALQDLATILARGYLRLIARKAVPGAASHLPETGEVAAKSLADFGEGSPHGRRG